MLISPLLTMSCIFVKTKTNQEQLLFTKQGVCYINLSFVFKT